jgi:5-methylcytosine-specific restriction endonuclease McrA
VSFLYVGDDMAQPWAEWFYKSKAWTDCRDAYFISQHGICERCPGAGKTVHHKIVLTPENINDPSITLNWEHLELLCQDCHNKEHHGSDEEVIREGLMFDENGDLVRNVAGGLYREY